jgi:hypothetical protein
VDLAEDKEKFEAQRERRFAAFPNSPIATVPSPSPIATPPPAPPRPRP